MARVFISYKREDKSKVYPLKDKIETAIGEPCWIDLDGIESDAQFVEVIMQAIDEASIFLFMYSKRHSKIKNYTKDWTVRELSYALKKEKRIVFVNIDNTPMVDWLDFMFPQKQQIDATSSEAVDTLLKDMQKWLGIKKEVKEVQPKQHKFWEKVVQRKRQLGFAALIVLSVVCLSVGTIYLFENRESKEQVTITTKVDIDQASKLYLWEAAVEEADSRLKGQKGTIQKAKSQRKPIAYIDLAYVMVHYRYAKDLDDQLKADSNSMVSKFNQQAKDLQKEVYDFQKKVDANAFLTRERAESEQKRLQQKQQELERHETQLPQYLEMLKLQAVKKIYYEIDGFIRDYNKQGQYEVVFVNNQYDITRGRKVYNISSEAVAELNSKYDK